MNTAATTNQPMDPRRQAKFLYWTGWRVTDIADFLSEREKTVHSWKARDQWDRADNVERIGGALEARLVQLILKDPKSGSDYKEIDLLHRQMERQARIINSWGKNIYVKIPVTNTKGKSAAALIKKLSHAGVQLNVTAIFDVEQTQAVCEALAGGALVWRVGDGRLSAVDGVHGRRMAAVTLG